MKNSEYSEVFLHCTFWGWWFDCSHYLLNLVDCWGSREERFAQDHLSKNTADAPHIDPLCVPVMYERMDDDNLSMDGDGKQSAFRS